MLCILRSFVRSVCILQNQALTFEINKLFVRLKCNEMNKKAEISSSDVSLNGYILLYSVQFISIFIFFAIAIMAIDEDIHFEMSECNTLFSR